MSPTGFRYSIPSVALNLIVAASLLLSLFLPVHLYADDLEKARSLEGAGKPSEAAAIYEKWLDVNRSSPEWGTILFRAANLLPSPDKESALLEHWLPKAPSSAIRHGILVRLAQLSELLGRLDQAQIYYEEASVVPGQRDLPSLLASATILFEIGEGDKAASQCRALLQLSSDPTVTIEARVLLAQIDATSGRHDRASAVLRGLLQPSVEESLTPQELLGMWRAAAAGGMDGLRGTISERLLARFPASPEAALLKDRAAPYPTPSTLLSGAPGGQATAPEPAAQEATPSSAGPNTGTAAERTPSTGAAPTTATPPADGTPTTPAAASSAANAATAATVIQVGSYLDRDNAAYRLKEVTEAGFHGEIREAEIRNRQYYRVVVIDVPSGQGEGMLAKLRDRGLDGFLTHE